MARLTRRDWIISGQDILFDEGFSELKLSKLLERLNVTSGSFYHHFTDIDDFRNQLADYYSKNQVKDLLNRISSLSNDPIDRITRLGSASIEEGLFHLDRAMRLWSSSNARAAKSMEVAEHIVLNYVSKEFKRVGYNNEDAMLRAQILISVNFTELMSISNNRNRGFRRRVLELLSDRRGNDKTRDRNLNNTDSDN